MSSRKRNIFDNFIELFFPRLCPVCKKKLSPAEEFVCLKCMIHLPRTPFRINVGNKMEELFYGTVPVVKAYAYFNYKKGSDYQNIIYRLKYKNEKKLGEYMGERFGAELLNYVPFPKIDFICPVPLHPKKEKKRGYNQSEYIAIGLSKSFHVPILKNNIQRVKYTISQTHKTRFERWENVQNIFKVVNPLLFTNKHIIIVDDVVTTGATLASCVTAIKSCCNAKVSLLTLGIAEK